MPRSHASVPRVNAPTDRGAASEDKVNFVFLPCSSPADMVDGTCNPSQLSCDTDWEPVYYNLGASLTAAIFPVLITVWLYFLGKKLVNHQNRGTLTSSWGRANKSDANTSLDELKGIVKDAYNGDFSSQGDVYNPEVIAVAFARDTNKDRKKRIKVLRDQLRDFWLLVGVTDVPEKFWFEHDDVWLHRARLFYNLAVPLDMGRVRVDYDDAVAKKAKSPVEDDPLPKKEIGKIPASIKP